MLPLLEKSFFHSQPGRASILGEILHLLSAGARFHYLPVRASILGEILHLLSAMARFRCRIKSSSALGLGADRWGSALHAGEG